MHQFLRTPVAPSPVESTRHAHNSRQKNASNNAGQRLAFDVSWPRSRLHEKDSYA
jgi:hypothetical protein